MRRPFKNSARNTRDGRRSGLSTPMRKHPLPAFANTLNDFGYVLPALRDPHHALVEQSHVQVTPEVASFRRTKPTGLSRTDRQLVRSLRPLPPGAYNSRTGRRHSSGSVWKASRNQRYRSGWLLHLRPVMTFRRLIAACLPPMILLAVTAGQTSPAPQITFNRDVAPIVFRTCAACHHPGGAGPFSLLSYADAKAHARQIATVTRTHFMPPWLPEPGDLKFADELRLSDQEITTIQEWQQQGAVEGSPSDLPASA